MHPAFSPDTGVGFTRLFCIRRVLSLARAIKAKGLQAKALKLYKDSRSHRLSYILITRFPTWSYEQ